MRTILLAIIFCFALTSCSVDDPQPSSVVETETLLRIWGKSIFGAAVEDIKKIYPNSVEPAESKEESDRIGLLMLDDVQIADTKFNAVFYFKKGARTLDSVTLNAPRDLAAGQANILFEKLQVLLNKKYGRMVSQSDKVYNSMATRSWVWIEGHRHISLTMIYVSTEKLGVDDYWSITVHYKKNDLADTVNL